MKTASFNSAYRKLVDALRELEDQHGQDPERIARQAVLTLSQERKNKSAYDRRPSGERES